MTQTHAIGQDIRSGERKTLTGRLIAFLYGLAAYATFFVSILYAIGFVSGIGVPKTIDSGPVAALPQALLLNLLLMSLFAIQHSVMARKQFKQWWTRFVPKSIERSTYVLLSSLALLLLFWQWRPIPAVVWQVANPQTALALMVLSLVGWALVFASTFLINHFELFGLHQVANNLSGRSMPVPRFRTPLFYKFVRHPIYLGFIIAFWAAPTMTRRALVVRGGDHGLYLCRHPAGRAGSRRSLRGRISSLQDAGLDAAALAQVGLTDPMQHFPKWASQTRVGHMAPLTHRELINGLVASFLAR